MENDNVLLKDDWSFWYHSSSNPDWSKQSYVYITNTNSANIFWGLFKKLENSHYDKGIFFFMRKDIFPDWSTPENKNGGFISIKIECDDIVKISKIWIEHMISECILTDNAVRVHGISISPKNEHYILKLWTNNKTKTSKLNDDLPLALHSKFTSFSYKR